VTNDGALSFKRSDEITVANAISGSGSLTQAGSNTVILTGTNTYTGTTTINSGASLQIGNGGTDGALASSSAISIAAGATLAYKLSTSTTSLTNTISGVDATSTISNLALGTTLNLSGATLSSFSAGTYQVYVDETTTQPTYSTITLAASQVLSTNTFKVVTTGYQSSFTAFDVFSWTGTATGTPTLNLNGTTVTSGTSEPGGTLTYYANSGVKFSANSSDTSTSSSPLLVDAGALQNSLKIELIALQLDTRNEQSFGMVTEGVFTEECVIYFENNFLGCK